jgi:hypothetical protein
MKVSKKLKQPAIVGLEKNKLAKINGGIGALGALAAAVGLGAAYVGLAKEIDELGHSLGKAIGDAIKK